jgi:hypothetical protein
MSDFDKLAMSIMPDNRRAMILLEEASRAANKEQALDLVRQVVDGQVRFEILRDEYPAVVLIRLDRDHVREAVLKLSAKGYTKLKAVEPPRSGTGIKGNQKVKLNGIR